ncbi:MAG: LPS-assembly protein LptD [Bacteroidaceae bacterium]|nr:LPS-assembly protein LptD [Bacteroidaceae bacterium]
MPEDDRKLVIPASSADSLAVADSLLLTPEGAEPLDSIPADSVASKEKEDVLEAPVSYQADDSIVWIIENSKAYLFKNSKVDYQKIGLTAEQIQVDIDTKTVYAHGVTDSLGVEIGRPVFKDGDTPYESDTMSYNFSSRKGYISNVVTQQGEGYMTSRDAKKGPDNEIYVMGGKYTTCDNHEHPHFYMALTRGKVRPGKNAVFGPAYLVVEDVPLPLAIPFGFFPFSNDKYASGFIMPTYGDELERGFYLRDGGYYFAISDYMDLKLTGEIFTKGSWGLNASSSYNKRYKYSGAVNLSMLTTKTGEKNMPDYMVSKDFKVQWTHRQDAKASPNSTFSASVNYATSSYERSNLNSQYNLQLSSQSTRTSSISYSRSFPNQNLTISGTFNIAQNVRDSMLSVSFPDLNISLSRIYPFRRKKRMGEERWYEKIALSYTGYLKNSINAKENKVLHSNLVKDWNNGMQHRIPINATFTLFKYLNLTAGFNYTERWYTYKQKRNWDEDLGRVVTDTIYGFNRVYNYDMSIGMNTKMYGFYKPSPAIFGDKIEMVRHVFTPSVTFSMAPDFGAHRYGYWDSYSYTDERGNLVTQEYSPYQGATFGVPGRGRTGSVNFSMSNNIEMKVKSDSDSTGVKKLSIIDDFGASISYNLAAERQPWSNLSMRLRLKLGKNKTFNINAVFATYAYEFNEKGQVVVGDRTEWSYGRFGRFQGMSDGFSYTFNNETFKKWFGPKEEETADGETGNDDELASADEERAVEPQRKKEKAKLDADGYMPFKIPWSLTVSWNYTLAEDRSKKINIKSMRYPYSFSHRMNISGNIKPSNKWNISFTSGYDFDTKRIAATTCNITRDLHCFTMSCGIILAPYTSYNFSISANSSMLADALKYDKRSSYSSNIDWY